MPLDVTTATFDQAVLQASRVRPVLVDFWAPWCGPCRSLAPILDELHAESGGRWDLVKANVEADPQLGTTWGARSIPLMTLFVDGNVAAQLTGLRSKAELAAWLARFVPGEEAEAVAAGRAAEASGDMVAAKAAYARALALKPRLDQAILGLARVAGATGDLEEAERLVEGHVGADAAAIRIAVAAAQGPSLIDARAAAETSCTPATLLALGIAEAGAANWEPALVALLEVVRRDRKLGDDAARKMMLEIFTALGPDDELADTWRRQLATVLF